MKSVNVAATILASATISVGCAVTPPEENLAALAEQSRASIEETREFIARLNPPTVRYVVYTPPLRYEYLNHRFVTLDAKEGLHLIEVDRDCPALASDTAWADMSDNERIRGRLRVRVDRLRGCRIDSIYKIPGDWNEPVPGKSVKPKNA
jgi:hypothetical protein